MKDRKKRQTLRIILVIAIVLVGIAALFPLFITLRYEKVVERKLPEWVSQASDSLYHTSVEDIDINIFTKNLTITGLKLSIDSSRLLDLSRRALVPEKLYRISIQKAEVAGIKWATILTDKELNCKRFVLSQPQVYIERPPAALSANKAPVPEHKKKGLPRFRIQFIDVRQPDITYKNFDHSDSMSLSLKGGSVSVTGAIYDPNESENLMKLLFAKSGKLHFDSLAITTSNSLYAIRSDDVRFTSTANSIEINNFNLIPAVSYDEYYKRTQEQSEIYTLKFPSIKLDSINWTKLLNQGEVHMKSIALTRPSISIYISRIPPPLLNKAKKFPTEKLYALKRPMHIERVTINDGSVNYTEKNKSTKQEGTLPLTHIEATVTNVTNIGETKKLNRLSVASGRGQLFGSLLGLNVTFDLNDTLGAFTATGFQTSLDGRKLNEITRPLAKMELQSLFMNKMEFSVKCDGRRGTANFLFLYDDLKLKILGIEDDGSLEGKGLISFIANRALLYPKNPMDGQPPRRVTFPIARDMHKSYFNLLWSTVRKGALLTAGRNPKISDLLTGKKN